MQNKEYFEMWNKLNEGQISEDQWYDYCTKILSEIMESNSNVLFTSKIAEIKIMHRKSWVYANSEWYDINDVIFIDVEEGPRGDEMSFKLEGSDTIYKSIITIGSQPG